jgi:hypothetical protein
MGQILGLGFSHYPGPLVRPEYWPRHLGTQVERGRISADLYNDRARWPEAMRAEWGTDDGQSAAQAHYKALIGGFRRLRKALDDFQPDLIVMWGDDQYENFRKDCVPPFCVFIQDEARSEPLRDMEKSAFRTPTNAWDLPPETVFNVRSNKKAANELTRYLLDEGVDVAYSLEMRYKYGLPHSFANAVMYLDFDQRGFDYPLIPFHVNCYGNQLMTTSASIVGESTGEMSPPAPSPRRCFEVGRLTARYFKDSPWRVALIASSSWSHGSLTKKHERLYPDIAADRLRYDDLKNNRLADWVSLRGSEIEDSGEHEMLNWVCLAGAMSETGQRVGYSELVETYIFNSTKCFAEFPPVPA